MYKSSHVIRSYSEAEALNIKKGSSYGTIIYVPENSVIDFKIQPWPPVEKKSVVCPRILLVSTWTDGKFGFPGGTIESNESPLDAMNREFHEEINTKVEFVEENFIFAQVMKGRMTYVFAKVTSDATVFDEVLMKFHSSRHVGGAYVNEILSVCGYPIWIEGPEKGNVEVANGKWNIFGFPRHLVTNGGFLTSTLNQNNIPRYHLLLLLIEIRIISIPLMERIFELTTFFNDDLNCNPIDMNFHEFCKLHEIALDAKPGATESSK